MVDSTTQISCHSVSRARVWRRTKCVTLSSFFGPCINVANSSHTPAAFGSVGLRTKLAAQICYMKIDAAIKRRELSFQDALNKIVTLKHLPGRFQKHSQQIKFSGSKSQGFARFQRGVRGDVKLQIS